MASETRVKNLFIDVLFLLDKEIDFTTESLVLAGQTFAITQPGEISFSTSNLTLSGQTFLIQVGDQHTRSMFFHF